MNIQAEYRHRIVSDAKLSRRMQIVVDSGNGIPGASAPGILRALGCQVREMYSEVDGSFPNHHPDPSKPENLAELIEMVKSTDAEIGLAFDGDGDRLGVVTKDGEVIYPDRQLMLLATDVLSRNKGATVIFDVKSSQRLAPAIRAAGGVPMIYKTGHSLIKAKMAEIGAPIAGEMSGHIFFGERWYGFDDATYTAARLLEILSRSDNPSAVLERVADQFQHAGVERGLRRRRAPPQRRRGAGARRRWPPGLPRRRGQHDRRPACGLARWLRPDPRVEHDAGDGVALRGPHPGALHRIEGVMMAALQERQTRRQDRRRPIEMTRKLAASRRRVRPWTAAGALALTALALLTRWHFGC